ncbi:hypothetical protein ACFE04_017014 [Oxalis oulophora]
MADGRRHSVDVPMSRTLIALRRVKSLRDPSTNSMSKFSTLLDNVNWETNSSTGISLSFLEGSSEQNVASFGVLNRLKEEQRDDFEFTGHIDDSKSKLVKCDDLECVDSSNGPITKSLHLDTIDKSSRRYRKQMGGDIEFIGRIDYSKSKLVKCSDLECVDSSNGPIVESSQLETIDKSTQRYRNQMGDLESRVGSSSPSPSDGLSVQALSLFGNDHEVDGFDYYNGCGITCCWSGTPKFKGSNASSDVEDYPLLSEDLSEKPRYRRKTIVDKNSETPRSLSQKFRPKSFNDLVGQNVVVKSLLNAISQKKITSFYLFHGPRGTGKTSASRIFAAALNCLSLNENKPCGLCRECHSFFSGRSKNVKEVDSVRINRTDRVRSLIKNAAIPPASSRFKIFIFDECQLLHGETWSTVLNSIENLSQHVVFLMITSDLDKLPRTAVARSQRYHFPKIKDFEIVSRLEKICVEEGLDYDKLALEFISAKSNGSLREAEMMLEQLSLLGKTITMSSAYELIGIVCDDELLDLLDLALSSDTSNTVIKARELMRSRIDPMQLTLQLANLIMDILAGKCQQGSSEARRRFSLRHSSEADLHKLNHALKILSDAEKQLRMSKNQTTWLTVALLQLSHVEASSSDANETKSCPREANRERNFSSTSSNGGSSKHLITCSSDDKKSKKSGIRDKHEGPLASLWEKATQLCRSRSLGKFLMKHGKLASLFVNQGDVKFSKIYESSCLLEMWGTNPHPSLSSLSLSFWTSRGIAVAELEFHQPNHASRAEKSWKVIASSLQSVLGSNVEIRINLVPHSRSSKVWKPSFSLFGCSRKMQQKSQSATECGSDSEFSDYASEKPMIGNGPSLPSNSGCGSQVSHNCCHKRFDAGRALRNSDGNILSTGTSKECEFQVLSSEEMPKCFPRTQRQKKKPCAADTSKMICTTDDQQQNKLALSFPGFDTPICESDHYVLCGGASNCNDKSRDAVGLTVNSDVLCWRPHSFALSKTWELPHRRRRSPLVEWVLPCAGADHDLLANGYNEEGSSRKPLLSFIGSKSIDHLNTFYPEMVSNVCADGKADDGLSLMLANVVWFDESLTRNSSFKQVVCDVFKVEINFVDFCNKTIKMKDDIWAHALGPPESN